MILDTSPLVAFIDRGDNFHRWAVEVWQVIEPPLLTCESVISEAYFLLRKTYRGQEAVISILDSEVIQIAFSLREEVTAVRQLLNRYQSVPISLADACLVRMSELIVGSCVLTMDSDFQVDRKNKNEMIDLIMADKV